MKRAVVFGVYIPAAGHDVWDSRQARKARTRLFVSIKTILGRVAGACPKAPPTSSDPTIWVGNLRAFMDVDEFTGKGPSLYHLRGHGRYK